MTLNSEGLEKLKPCPFCGSDARLLGGPEAQETYSIWCGNGHHTAGSFDRDSTIAAWNRRALPPVDRLEVVAFRHPESDWAHVQYSEIDMHCRKDGPRPIPLVTLSQASSVIAGLNKRIEELERARDDAQTANASLSRLIDELDPKFELSRTIARISSLEEENRGLIALIEEKGSASLIRAARQALEDHNG
jgi:hypothetical protein